MSWSPARGSGVREIRRTRRTRTPPRDGCPSSSAREDRGHVVAPAVDVVRDRSMSGNCPPGHRAGTRSPVGNRRRRDPCSGADPVRSSNPLNGSPPPASEDEQRTASRSGDVGAVGVRRSGLDTGTAAGGRKSGGRPQRRAMVPVSDARTSPSPDAEPPAELSEVRRERTSSRREKLSVGVVRAWGPVQESGATTIRTQCVQRGWRKSGQSGGGLRGTRASQRAKAALDGGASPVGRVVWNGGPRAVTPQGAALGARGADGSPGSHGRARCPGYSTSQCAENALRATGSLTEVKMPAAPGPGDRRPWQRLGPSGPVRSSASYTGKGSAISLRHEVQHDEWHRTAASGRNSWASQARRRSTTRNARPRWRRRRRFAAGVPAGRELPRTGCAPSRAVPIPSS